MPFTLASAEVAEASIEAVIIRADGTRVPLGVISYWHKDPLKMLAWKVKQALKPAPQKEK